MEWYQIAALCVAQLLGALGGLIAWDKWRESKRDQATALLTKELEEDNRIDDLIAVVEQIKRDWDTWFPAFSPEDLTSIPRPGVVTALRDHNRRLSDVETATTLIPNLDKNVTSILRMLDDGQRRFADLEGRMTRVEDRHGETEAMTDHAMRRLEIIEKAKGVQPSG